MRYAYPCDIVADAGEYEASGRIAFNVEFPDVYGAKTGAWSKEEAFRAAKDCLGVALGMYVNECEDIPAPSPLREGQVLIAVPSIVAAKLALYSEMRKQDIKIAELGGQTPRSPERGAQNPRSSRSIPHFLGRECASCSRANTDRRRCPFHQQHGSGRTGSGPTVAIAPQEPTYPRVTAPGTSAACPQSLVDAPAG